MARKTTSRGTIWIEAWANCRRRRRANSGRPRRCRYSKRSVLLESLETRRPLAVAATSDFVFPDDAGVIDLTNWNADPALNADPAPGNNDTAALQAALDSLVPPDGAPNSTPTNINRILYLPAGEYLIDRELTVPIRTSNRASVGAILQGENRDKVTIKLMDNLNWNGSALRFQVLTADAFRNAVRDLTIDIGQGNPDATGLTFVGNNQSTVRNVHVRSSDPAAAGDVGLELGTGANGPLLVENVSVDGFDVGIRTAFQDASQTFEDIELTNQKVYGWVNEGDQNVFVRNLTSVNEVPAIWNHPAGTNLENAVFTLVDGDLRGVGDAINQTAIRTEERFYGRNVDTPGYDRAIVRVEANGFLQGNFFVDGQRLDEYWSQGSVASGGGTHELFEGSPDTTLMLPIRDAPEIPLDPDLTRWASPADFVTVNHDGTPSGIADDEFDDAMAIQAAIDSGATTLYFPFGNWFIEQSVTVGGSVERIHGMESTIATATGDGGFRIDQTDGGVLVYERISSGFGGRAVALNHVSDTTLVARNLQGFNYRPIADAPGDVFIYDIVHGELTFRNQNVWARQLNVEGATDVNDPTLGDQKILNDNANLWVLGLKIENQGTIVRNINGGNAELLGVYRNNNNFSDADNPAFVTVDAHTTVVNFDAATAASNAYALWVSETRDGETRTSPRFGGSLGHIYSGFDSDALWNQQQTVIVDNRDPGVTLQGDWSVTDSFPGGFIDQDALFSRDENAIATFAANLPAGGRYEVSLRWMNNWGGQDHTNHARAVPVTILHRDGQTTTTVDQQFGGNRWNSLGTFDFAADGSDRLQIASDGSGRAVIADAVQFVLIEPDEPLPPPPRFPIRVGTDRYANEIFAGGDYSFTGDANLLANDSDDDDRPLTITSVLGPRGGIATVDANGDLNYRPYGYFTGWDQMTYTVSNGVQSATGTVEFFVADALADDGTLLRPRSAAEIAEASSTIIDGIRVVQYDGNGRASTLLGPGQITDPVGVSGYPGHLRDGDNIHFVGPANASILLDLGDVYSIDTSRIWNYNQQDGSPFFSRRTSDGAETIRVWVDTDDDGNGLADDLQLADTVTLGEATARNDYSGQVFAFDGVEARFVQLEIVSTHSDDPSRDESGLSDVEFRGTLVRSAATRSVPNVLVASSSSQVNNDRPASRTLGRGYNAADNFHDSGRSNNWQSAVDDPLPEIVYDLNDIYDLGSVRLWNVNYAPDLDRGAKTIDIFSSTDNQTFAFVKTVDLAKGTGQFVDHGEAFDLSGVTARYIRLQITETHGADDGAGLAEVRFAGDLVIDRQQPIGVASIAASSDVGDSVDWIVDRSGLDDEGLVHFDQPQTQYRSAINNLTPTIDLELADLAILSKFDVWNFTSSGSTGFNFDRGIRSMRVSTSIDGVDYQPQRVFDLRRGFTSTQFESLNFDAPTLAKFVRLEVLSNHGDTQFTGLSEIQFLGEVAEAIPPTVESVQINDGEIQRSRVDRFEVTFSEQVRDESTAFEIENMDTGEVTFPIVTWTVVADRSVATLQLDAVQYPSGSLTDGNYRLRILDSIVDAVGNRLDGDGDGVAGGTATEEFFRLYGDVNADRAVDLDDFLRFREAYGQSGDDAAAFDFGGDGQVDLDDFFRFRQRFGRTI